MTGYKSLYVFFFALALSLAGCGSGKTHRDGPGNANVISMPGDAIPKPEARSKYGNGRDLGNGAQYEVLNKTYIVMESSINYQERGVASWYGSKFHGNLTSNREVYNMYGMTAAHKTLPLPTYVHVRNLRNNKNIIVRVNDRGPFVNNRIIDLSYIAAMKLDMIDDGTSLVEVTAINFDKPAKKVVSSHTNSSIKSNRIYVQVGAFSDRSNAERRLAILSQAGVRKTLVHEDVSSGITLFRVRVGPIANTTQYDLLVEKLEGLGITDPYLITE